MSTGNQPPIRPIFFRGKRNSSSLETGSPFIASFIAHISADATELAPTFLPPEAGRKALLCIARMMPLLPIQVGRNNPRYEGHRPGTHVAGAFERAARALPCSLMAESMS